MIRQTMSMSIVKKVTEMKWTAVMEPSSNMSSPATGMASNGSVDLFSIGRKSMRGLPYPEH